MKASQILLKDEVLAILKRLKRSGFNRTPQRRQNLALFRLLCGCGLRRAEARNLNLGNLIVSGPRPCLHVRFGKGGRHREVPLTWDRGTLLDLAAWREERLREGATHGDPVLVGQHSPYRGERLNLSSIWRRWKTIMRDALEPERAAQVSGCHSGRGTFITLAKEAGHSWAEIRDAVGHSNLATTSIYTIAIPRACPDLFAPTDGGKPPVGVAFSQYETP